LAAAYEAARQHPRFRLCGAPWEAPGLRYRFLDGDTHLLPSIELIETSGHVPGHQSVLVRLPETGPVLLAIDAITGPEHLALDAKRASVRKLRAIAERDGVALIVFGHDPEQWRILRKSPEFYA
jgi:N-acyl homoserine lactone hydrolase